MRAFGTSGALSVAINRLAVDLHVRRRIVFVIEAGLAADDVGEADLEGRFLAYLLTVRLEPPHVA